MRRYFRDVYQRPPLARPLWVGSFAVIPNNTVPPVVSGTTTVGQTLSCTTGTWTNSPTGYAYQWQRDGHGDGVYSDIGGALSATYVLLEGDDQCNMRCRVTASNAFGSNQATSNSIGIVLEPVPVNTVAPVASGTATVGQNLTVSTGTWNNMGGYLPTFTYQWQRDNSGGGTYSNIGGATSSAYILVLADVGCFVRCVVTAHNSGGTTAANSNTRGLVANAPATLTIEMAFGSGPGSSSPTWTDISSYVRSCNWQRGRQNELNQMQAGTGQMVLADPNSHFDPRNASSPFYPNVRPGTPVRARLTNGGVSYPLFYMFTERQPRTMRVASKYAERQIDMVDGFSILANAGLAGASYGSETTSTRVTNVLNTVGWPSLKRVIGTGISTILAATFPADDGTSAQAHLLDVTDTENGVFFCDGNGDVNFVGRHQLITDSAYTVSSATFCDSTGSSGYPYVDLIPSFDVDQVFNKWVGTRPGGTPQTSQDTSSQTQYFLREKQFASLATTDAEVLNQADWKRGQFSQPLDRVESITVMPLTDPTNTARAAASLAREVGDRITVLETPPAFGVEQSDDYIIQHLSGQIVPGPIAQMKLTFLLWPAATVSFWIAGDANLSLAGLTTKPGY